MKICPKCGHVTSDDSDGFCVKCGAYYVEDVKQQQSSPLASAMGMTPAPVKAQAVPVAEGGTLEGGFDHMASGNYPEALAQWISFVRENGQPSDEQYEAMVKAALDCLMSTMGDSKVHNRSGTAELAMELDSDFIQDLMSGLRERASGLSSCNAMADLVVEYMYLVMESFSVYPDLRDVSEIFSSAKEALDGFKAMSESMEKDDSGRCEREIGISMSYVVMMSDEMARSIAQVGDEKMDRLADYWSTKSNLPYANIAYQIANLNAQISVAKNVGKLTGKLLQKGLSIQVDGFKRAYFGPRV